MTGLRIGIVNHHVEIGGAEVALLRLTEALGERHNLRVFLPGDGPLVEALEHRDVTVSVVSLPGRSLAAKRGQSGRLLVRILGDGFRWRGAVRRLSEALGDVDVVVTGSTKAHLYGGWAGREAGRPVIWWFHDTVDSTTFGALSGMLVRRAARRLPDRIIAVSQTSASSLRLPPGDPRVRVIHNGVRTRDAGVHGGWTGEIKGGGPRVGWIGRLVPSKAPGAFLEACANVAGRVPDVSFVLVGGPDARDPGYAGVLERQARDHRIGDRVEFTGHRNDLEEIFRGLDVMVFTSLASESLPNVILEAMASGVPVVAFAGGGVAEIAGDSGAVLQIPRGNPAALADAVVGLLERGEERRALARRGEVRIHEVFGWDRWVEAWERELGDLPVGMEGM